MENKEVAKILRETAQLTWRIDGAMIGRYRSYEKVAELLYNIPERVEELAQDDIKFKELPGVGDGMAEHIHEILKSAITAWVEKLLKKYPTSLLDLLQSCNRSGPRRSHFSGVTIRQAMLRKLESWRAKASYAICPVQPRRASKPY